MRLARVTLAAFLIFALVGCGGGGVALIPTATDSGTALTSSISSAQTGNTYSLDIWLPPGYGQGTSAYPVVYAMDCEYRFATLMADLQQRAAEGATPVILVNVCAGATRWSDFTMPGAAPYFRFLTLELIPFIEANYRADPANRVLSGHSLSGELVLYALYIEDPAHRYFTSIISEECSCWYDASMNFQQQLALPLAMELAMYDANHSLPINLVMAGDSFANEPNVLVVYNTISSQHFQNLRSIQPIYSLGHVPMDGPAFSDALTFIFD